MRLFRQKRDSEEGEAPAPEAAPAQPLAAEEPVSSTHGDQLSELTEPPSRRDRRRLQREERRLRRAQERAQWDEERAAKRQQKEARRNAVDSSAAEAPTAALSEEERANREAAERAALARLDQPLGAPSPGSEPDPFEEEERARQEQEDRVRAEAERRIRAAEEAQLETETGAEEAGARPSSTPIADPPLGEQPDDDQAVAAALTETEERLAENQRRTAESLERAAKQLEEVEARAAEAEQRASRAERLAALKAEEIERAERLRTMLDRIAKAEQRASESEQRARAAVERFSEPVPEIDPDAVFAHLPAEPEVELDAEPEPPQAPAAVEDAGPVDLNQASYEQLRGLGLSVTQTGRLLAHRERADGFTSLDELEGIPGFSRSSLDELKRRVRL